MSRTRKPFSRRASPQHPQMERSGCCGRGFWCLGSLSRNRRKRIVPATRLHDGTTQSSHAWGANGAPPSGAPNLFASLSPSLLAPPSSPASHQNSMYPSSAQSPAGYVPPSSNVRGSSSIPLETTSNMFVTGPYAHETALVSPPVFSTFTTAPSTAPFTPPPELAAHLTTPSSPDVPFAKLLASSLSEKRSSVRQSDAPYYDVQQDDLQTAYQLYPGSPLARLISPAGGTGASTPFAGGGTGTSTPLPAGGGTGTSTPYPEAEKQIPLTVLPAVVSSLPTLELPNRIGLQASASPNVQQSMPELHQMEPLHSAESSQSPGLLNPNCNGSGEAGLGPSGDCLELGDINLQTLRPARDSFWEDRVKGNQIGEDREEDLLELPVLLRVGLAHREEGSLKVFGLPERDAKAQAALNMGREDPQSREPQPTRKLETCREEPEEGDGEGLDLADQNEDNLLEYALSLLEGKNVDSGGPAVGWVPVDSSLTQSSAIHPTNGIRILAEDNNLSIKEAKRMDRSKSLKMLLSEDGEQHLSSNKGKPCMPMDGKEAQSEECAVKFSGCCSECGKLSLALKEAEKKHAWALKHAEERYAEKERLADNRERALRQLLQWMQMGAKSQQESVAQLSEELTWQESQYMDLQARHLASVGVTLPGFDGNLSKVQSVGSMIMVPSGGQGKFGNTCTSEMKS